MLNKINELRQQGKKIGFTCSTADLGHAGFLLMIEECKRHCDYLVFGLLSDPTIDRPNDKNFPIETLFERWIRVSSNKNIDLIIPFSHEKDIINIVKIIKPDVRIVGMEYKDINHTGKGLCPIFYNERNHNYSSTELRERIFHEEFQKLNNNV